MRDIGTIASIWRYPVKSLRGESLDRADVDVSGLAGDRTRALGVREGHARAGKTYRGKENDRLHLVGDARSAFELAAMDGVGVDLLEEARYFDDAPISLLVDRWLNELSAHVGYAVEPERFRPNFFVHADASFDAGERELEGATLVIGGIELRVRSPIERCVTTTYDPAGGPSDPRILRFVAQQRNVWMGIYCDVAIPGAVRVGDVVSAREAP